MSKIIFFVIIISLIGIIISLLWDSINRNDTIKHNNIKRTELDELIETLREKIKSSRQEAIDGKLEATNKIVEYEIQLKQAEELSKKYN